MYWQAADGSGMAEPLTEGNTALALPNDFSPDGTTFLYQDTGNDRDIWMVPVDGSTTVGTPLLAGPANEAGATVSPDGHWLAYRSDESGENEIYVRPFPAIDEGLWQISTASGHAPRWSRDGDELFFVVFGGGLSH